MKTYICLLLSVILITGATTGMAAESARTRAPSASSLASPRAEQSITQGSVTIEGQKIDYTATAGTIVLRDDQNQPTGSMFYVAYTKRGVKDPTKRPVTFFYNGGPGSSTIWLHMGAFGPWRVATTDAAPTPPAPYGLVNNDYSLLDATDEVFIDAMGTGYSRIIGKDQGGVGTPKDFYGDDPDVKAFAQFISRYLSANSRWNSPKYIYGESYGTIRSQLLVNYLEQRDFTDLNGVILQSSTAGFGFLSFAADNGDGHDLTYELFLPSYAATAWYHHKLANQPAQLQPFLQQAQQFAMNDYAAALNAGNTLSSDQFNSIAEKLHDYTGLSTAYIKKANLRVTASEFFHELLGDNDQTVGRLDSRFVGPSMDPMSQGAEYDPQAAAMSSAYATVFKDYAHDVLKYGRDQIYLPEAYGTVGPWDMSHSPYGSRSGFGRGNAQPNVAVDLAQAMKHDPNLQVLLNSGYYDLATPYFGMDYSINHLDIPPDLRSHIHRKYYESGHMIYVNIPALKELHDNTAAFIEATENIH